MKKRNLLLLATIAGTLAVTSLAGCGCGKEKETQTTTVAETTTDETTTEETTTEETSTEETTTEETTEETSTEDETTTRDQTTKEVEATTKEPVTKAENNTTKKASGNNNGYNTGDNLTGHYESQDDGASRQFNISKNGNSYTIEAIGMQGDSFCQFSSTLKKVGTSVYQVTYHGATLKFTLNGKTMTVSQSGSFSDNNVKFNGTYQMTRKTPGI